MTWSFLQVRRAILDAAERRADSAERDALIYKTASDLANATMSTTLAMLNAERERYDSLLARYHQLRLQGFSEPAAPVVRPVVPPDPIKRAIAQRAGTNRALREAMERQVATDRLLGKSDEEILSAIIAGVSGEDLILSEAGLMSP